MTRRQAVRRKLAQRARPADPTTAVLAVVRRTAPAVLAATRDDFPPGAGNSVPISLAADLVLRRYGVDAQAVPVRRSIAGGREVEHAVVLVRSPATDVIVDLTINRPEPWFVTGDEPGLRIPDQPITVGTTPSITFTLRPNQGWNAALLAAVRPTMPPMLPDEVVLAMYQAGLAEYAAKAVGILNRTPGLT